MTSESKERRLAQLGVTARVSYHVKAGGASWFGSPASTKGGGAWAFLSACPDVGQKWKTGGGGFKAVNSKKRRQTPYHKKQ